MTCLSKLSNLNCKMKKLQVLESLKNPVSLFTFLGVAVLFFDLNYYFMVNLPGTVGLACAPGANLTATNMIFSILLSLLTALMVSGVMMLYRQRSSGKKSAAGIAGVAAIIGTFTVFCTTCSIPIISLFGLSVGLTFFTTYNLAFKIVSLLLMIIGLYYLEKQLRGNCQMCKN